jgi:hypothetical protein
VRFEIPLKNSQHNLRREIMCVEEIIELGLGRKRWKKRKKEKGKREREKRK